MSNNLTMQWQSISACHWQNIIQQLTEAYGLRITANSGSAIRHGIGLKWHYSPEQERLEVSCFSKPMLVPLQLIQSKLQSAVDDCRPH